MSNTWPNSYVIYLGRRINLETSYIELQQQMRHNRGFITVKVLDIPFNKDVTLNKLLITNYGR